MSLAGAVVRLFWDDEPTGVSPKRIEVVDGYLAVVYFPYNSQLVEELKCVPGAKWHAQHKQWEVPIRVDSIGPLISFAERHRLAIPSDLRSKAGELHAEASFRSTASRAASSDYKVEGLAREPYPFQHAGVEYLVRAERALLCDDMGLGKTIQALAMAHVLNAFPFLIICPASLKYNWAREIRTCLPPGRKVFVVDNRKQGAEDHTCLAKMGAKGAYQMNMFGTPPPCRTCQFEEADVVIINYDILADGWDMQGQKSVKLTPAAEAIRLRKFKLHVADEIHYCFVGDTLVETEFGRVSIKELVEKELPLRVWSCNSLNNAIELQRIEKFHTYPLYASLLKVKHTHGQFICTADHKIYTDAGRKEASTLREGDCLRSLQSKGFCASSESFLRLQLRRYISDAKYEPNPSREAPTDCISNEPSKSREEAPGCYAAHDRIQSYVSRRMSEEGFSLPEGGWASTANKRWQWASSSNACCFTETAVPDSAIRTSNLYQGDPRGSRLYPYLLQGRLGTSENAIGDRSRRLFAQYVKGERKGREEKPRLATSRVESIEIFQPGCNGEDGDSGSGYQNVYCLTVANNHNFFANGVLVANCKNDKAQRSIAAHYLVEGVKYRLGLTGTPVLNTPIDLVSPLKWLGRLDEFGGWWKYVNRYCGAVKGRFGWEFKRATHAKELNDRLRASCYVRRLKSDVLKELPPKVRVILDVDIDNTAEYEKAQRELITWVKEKAYADRKYRESIADLDFEEQERLLHAYAADKAQKAKRAEAVVKLSALKQITAKGKLSAAKEWIDNFLETGNKLVVFATHKEILEKLQEMYPTAARIVAEDSAQVRDNNVQTFQGDPSCKMLIGAQGTSANNSPAGVGHTLTAASHCLCLELGWNNALHDQCEDRLHRIGQKDSVTAYRMLGVNTIDQELDELIENKRQMCQEVADGLADEIVEEKIVNELLKRIEEKS